MFKDEEEKWARYRDLTQIMENVPPKQPSEDFTARVMARLPEGKVNVRQFSLRRFFGNPDFATDVTIDFQHSVTKKECAFYFFLTGFFYFVLGLILMLGLPRPTGLFHQGWLAVQPLVGLLLAAELTALGVAVYTNGDSAIRFVRAGTLFYAALIILNGWLGTFYMQIPATIFFAAIFSLTGLGIAVLLRLAIDRYSPETISLEVHG
jgi:hypothetical protein